MSQTRSIVVFWIDEAPRQDFAERLANAGMQVFHADNYVDGVEWLSNPKNRDICDAVILDVNCKIRMQTRWTLFAKSKNASARYTPTATLQPRNNTPSSQGMK